MPIKKARKAEPSILALKEIEVSVISRRNSRIKEVADEKADAERRQRAIANFKEDLLKLFPATVKFDTKKGTKTLIDMFNTSVDGTELSIDQNRNRDPWIKVYPERHEIFSISISDDGYEPDTTHCKSYLAAIQLIAEHLVEEEVIPTLAGLAPLGSSSKQS